MISAGAGTSISEKAKKKAAKGKANRKESEEAILAMASEFRVSEATDGAPKKGRFKTLILLAVALLVVGAGAGGAWFFLLRTPVEVAEVVGSVCEDLCTGRRCPYRVYG